MTIFAKKACRIIFLLGLSVGNSPATSLFWLRFSQSSFAIGKIIPIENIEAKEIVRVRKRINNIISNATGQPLEKVEKDTDRNYWLNAEEAVDYGIVNKIITSYDELPNL